MKPLAATGSSAKVEFLFTVYRVHSDELDERFLERVKAAFLHKEIEIAIGELRPADELMELRRRAEGRTDAGGPFTGREALRFWREVEHLDAVEAESFARDVESARDALPPLAARWD